MNILFISPTPFHPERGGVGRVTDILCKEFQKKGENIFYLNLDWYNEDRKKYPYPTSVNIFPEPKNIYCEKNILFYDNFLKENNIDLVINQDGLSSNSRLFLNIHNSKVKKVSVFHNNPFMLYDNLWYYLKSLRNDTVEEKIKRFIRCILYLKIKNTLYNNIINHFRFIYNNSDAIVVLSEEYKKKMLNLSPWLEDRLYVINNPNSFDTVDCIPKKEKIILYVGRLSNKEKRIDRLLNIWNSVSKKHKDWTLYIVGDGKDKEFLENFVNKNNIQNVKFMGSSNPISYYKKASIVCLTSDFEGMPMTLIEGMQFGCIPICFDSFDAAHDIIESGICGELVKPYNLDEYRIKLDGLMQNANYRKQLSNKCHERSARFDKEKIISDWFTLISKL